MARKPKATASNTKQTPGQATKQNSGQTKSAQASHAEKSGATLGLGELRVRLNYLEQENQKLLKQIEKNRSELDKISSGIKDLGIQIAQRSAPLVEKLSEIDSKIHTLFAEIVTGRKLGKKTIKDLKSVYYGLQSQGLISPKFLPGDTNPLIDLLEHDEEEENDQPDWDDRGQRSQPQDRSETQKLDREQLKKIRHTYLELADIFHPDKVSDPTEREYCTEVMKEINQAYQTGDLAKLLAIKKKQELNEVIDADSSDDLKHQCAKIEAENALLKEQLESSKSELRKTKKTEGGMILAQYKKLTKYGEDPIAEALEDLEVQIQATTDLCQFVTDFRDRKITIKEFMQGPVMPNQVIELSDEDIIELLMRF